MYRDLYPLPQKSQIEQKIDEINDLVAENKRITNEFMERMDNLCQRLTDDQLSEEKINTFTSLGQGDILFP